MKILRRNSTEFEHLAYKGKTEVLDNGKHTGRFTVEYADPVVYRGNIDVPSGFVARELFGLNLDYTHVIVMDDPDAPFEVEDRIEWKGRQYEILAVKPSLNVLSVAMKVLSPDSKWVKPDPPPTPSLPIT